MTAFYRGGFLDPKSLAEAAAIKLSHFDRAKDKTNIVIEPAKYRDGGGDCAVRWIVETAGSDGVNYAVHSLCTSASLPEKTQTKDIIVRPLGPDRAAMGRSFEDLKNYQRCP